MAGLDSTRLRALTARQFSSLHIYNYRVYFIGQLISLVGTWMQTTAQAWLVLKLTGSPVALGTVTTLQFLPITVFTLFGGAFADRLPKRRVLIITQTLAMIQAFVLGLLVGRDQLVNAVALNSSIFNMARIMGPAVAGMAIAAVGLAPAFLVNACSFIGVLVAYTIMRPAEFHSTPPKQANGNVLTQVREGLVYSWRTPQVLFLFILLAFLGTFGYNFTVIIPLVAEFVLKVGPKQFGMLTSAMGLGSLVAALSMAAAGKLSHRNLLLATTTFVVLLCGIALSQSYYATALLMVALGVVSVLFSTTINTTLQIVVPDELRGRVMSIFFLLFAGSTPLGGYLTGVLAEQIGVTRALLVMASLCVVGIVLAAAYRQMVGIGRQGAPAVPPEPMDTPKKQQAQAS